MTSIHKSHKLPARLIGFVSIIAIALTYAAYTNHAWEDYYITYRSSKNLAIGNGLVFQPGERVHSFTSAFNVLVPAGICWITNNTSDQLVLWIFRIFSASLLAAAWLLLDRVGTKSGFGLNARFLLLFLIAFECKIIDFTVNGQEIGFMIFFISATIASLNSEKRRWIWLGLSLAGLQYTRPDGFIYYSAATAAYLLFPLNKKDKSKARISLFQDSFKAGLLAIALFTPWLYFTWKYYGSPIPHTITAKGTLGQSHEPLVLLKNALAYPLHVLQGSASTARSFLPIYAEEFGGWHYTVYLFGKWFGALLALYWILPFGSSHGRAASLSFMISHYYLTHVAAYPAPWYLSSGTIFGIFAFAFITSDLLKLKEFLKSVKRTREARGLSRIATAITSITVAAVGMIFCATALQIRAQQNIIENENRTQLGLWLRNHAASPTDTVFLRS